MPKHFNLDTKNRLVEAVNGQVVWGQYQDCTQVDPEVEREGGGSQQPSDDDPWFGLDFFGSKLTLNMGISLFLLTHLTSPWTFG